MKIKLSLLLGLLFALFACKETVENEVQSTDLNKNQADFEGVEVLFDEKEFSDGKMSVLLKEINICGNDSLGVDVPECSPEFFKFFSLKNGMDLENGFILLTKANTGGIALRRVLVFEREEGKLTKVNGFIANIIGQRKSKSGYNDLLLRFKDVLEGSDIYYNCLFQWTNNKYEFKSVEVIEEPGAGWRGRVTEEHKDSISKEIYQTILDNKMIF